MKNRTTNRPVWRRVTGMSSSEARPVEIDGMEVIADERVTLFPVSLVEVPAAPPESTDDGGTL
jgi:hypothetical protein